MKKSIGAGEWITRRHFHITIHGQPPGNAHGMDADAEGNGVVTTQRLYQLVRALGRRRRPHL